MNETRSMMIIEYGYDDFADDHPELTPDQLKAILTRLESEMCYSMIDEYIRGSFADMAEEMFPDDYETTEEI